MAELSEADRLLLDGVRRGDAEAWRQLVSLYQGRLVAFARSSSRDPASAEDLVQETFLAFLQSLHRYRGDAGLETYLFTILRRRVIDQFRGRRPADSMQAATEDQLTSRDPSPSFYIRRDEDATGAQQELVGALRALAHGLQEKQRFDDLLVVDLVFTSGLGNQDIATRAGVTGSRVGVVKHRALQRLRETVAGSAANPRLPDDQTLAGLWREYRLGCPKRSTIGGYLLGTLGEPWMNYVRAHLEAVGCPTCQANLDDLRAQTASVEQQQTRERILNSTIGFIPAPG
ncbi:MAG: sigma-70 family RNA polymerase sigma factor [Planctomycetota bacterium]